MVQEFPINDALTSPAQSAIFSVNMLVGTRTGHCYSPGEIKQWLSKTGFGSILVRNLEETVIVEGRVKIGQPRPVSRKDTKSPSP